MNWFNNLTFINLTDLTRLITFFILTLLHSVSKIGMYGLLYILTYSFSTGVFPTMLKVAKVVPVYKKDSKLDFSNYQPISLLSNIEKILEKLMYNRVYNFFTKNNLIYPLQFGFRQQYSTFHALISLTEDIRKNLDKGNIGCGIFVDLQKAFDAVEHDILLANDKLVITQ